MIFQRSFKWKQPVFLQKQPLAQGTDKGGGAGWVCATGLDESVIINKLLSRLSLLRDAAASLQHRLS